MEVARAVQLSVFGLALVTLGLDGATVITNGGQQQIISFLDAAKQLVGPDEAHLRAQHNGHMSNSFSSSLGGSWPVHVQQINIFHGFPLTEESLEPMKKLVKKWVPLLQIDAPSAYNAIIQPMFPNGSRFSLHSSVTGRRTGDSGTSVVDGQVVVPDPGEATMDWRGAPSENRKSILHPNESVADVITSFQGNLIKQGATPRALEEERMDEGTKKDAGSLEQATLTLQTKLTEKFTEIMTPASVEIETKSHFVNSLPFTETLRNTSTDELRTTTSINFTVPSLTSVATDETGSENEATDLERPFQEQDLEAKVIKKGRRAFQLMDSFTGGTTVTSRGNETSPSTSFKTSKEIEIKSLTGDKGFRENIPNEEGKMATNDSNYSSQTELPVTHGQNFTKVRNDSSSLLDIFKTSLKGPDHQTQERGNKKQSKRVVYAKHRTQFSLLGLPVIPESAFLPNDTILNGSDFIMALVADKSKNHLPVELKRFQSNFSNQSVLEESERNNSSNNDKRFMNEDYLAGDAGLPDAHSMVNVSQKGISKIPTGVALPEEPLSILNYSMKENKPDKNVKNISFEENFPSLNPLFTYLLQKNQKLTVSTEEFKSYFQCPTILIEFPHPKAINVKYEDVPHTNESVSSSLPLPLYPWSIVFQSYLDHDLNVFHRQLFDLVYFGHVPRTSDLPKTNHYLPEFSNLSYHIKFPFVLNHSKCLLFNYVSLQTPEEISHIGKSQVFSKTPLTVEGYLGNFHETAKIYNKVYFVEISMIYKDGNFSQAVSNSAMNISHFANKVTNEKKMKTTRKVYVQSTEDDIFEEEESTRSAEALKDSGETVSSEEKMLNVKIYRKTKRKGNKKILQNNGRQRLEGKQWKAKKELPGVKRGINVSEEARVNRKLHVVNEKRIIQQNLHKRRNLVNFLSRQSMLSNASYDGSDTIHNQLKSICKLGFWMTKDAFAKKYAGKWKCPEITVLKDPDGKSTRCNDDFHCPPYEKCCQINGLKHRRCISYGYLLEKEYPLHIDDEIPLVALLRKSKIFLRSPPDDSESTGATDRPDELTKETFLSNNRHSRETTDKYEFSLQNKEIMDYITRMLNTSRTETLVPNLLENASTMAVVDA